MNHANESTNRASVDSSRTLVDPSANNTSTTHKASKQQDTAQQDTNSKPKSPSSSGKQFRLSDDASKIPFNMKQW